MREREYDREEPVEWIPKTSIGRKVKAGEIKDIKELIDNGIKVKEVGIIDSLMPNIESDLILIGQAKGKFGGGKRRAFKQVQKKTQDGNKPSFLTMAVVGNRNGVIGVGLGKSLETVPAREKALRHAKLSLFSIRRGCGSWECGCGTPHSIPFTVTGKSGSTIVKLMPAPKGVGLCIHNEAQKVLDLAGVKDVWSWSSGQTRTSINLIYATINALKKLKTTVITNEFKKKAGCDA